MKKVKVFSSISEFEKFVNSVEVLDVKVVGCEQSYSFQECFIGVVFYKEAQQENIEPKIQSASPNNTERDEILTLLNDALDEFSEKQFDNGKYYLEQAMSKLSPVS